MMMDQLKPAVLLVLCLITGTAYCDAKDDARFIVEQTVNEREYSSMLSAMEPVLYGAIENELRKKGIKLSNPKLFYRIFIEEWLGDFTREMQRSATARYLEVFTGKELADIAAFLKSDSGRAFISQSAALAKFGAEEGNRVGQKVGLRVGPRVAERLQKEGVQITEAGMMDKLLEVLRGKP